MFLEALEIAICLRKVLFYSSLELQVEIKCCFLFSSLRFMGGGKRNFWAQCDLMSHRNMLRNTDGQEQGWLASDTLFWCFF